ncbi:L30e-like protein [Xylariomycetidae sp. FL0641]|nr:L30e-like protein [Xylariomycetidae sp. FL0641]
MGSTKPEKEKKEKKDKKRSEADGVGKPKKEKKDKKEKKEKLKHAVNAALDDELQADAAASAPSKDSDDEEGVAKKASMAPVVGALVPFARPLADDKGTKKVMKSVRKAAKNKCLKRGVKEVVKALRKSPAAGPGNPSAPGVVVLAGDISPMDVISHIPVLCEDVNAPYIFVASRAELGAAGSTKRPTSVVMVTEKPSGGGKKSLEKVDEADAEDFAETYKDLVKLVEKEQKQLKI